MKNSIKRQTYLSAHIIILICFMGIYGCSESGESQAQKNKNLVKKTFEIVANGDYHEMDNYIAQDYVRHCQATPELVIESLDAFKDFIRNDRNAVPDQKLNVKMLVAEGDLVAFWATYTGTQTGQMGPFPPTGKSANLDFAGVHRVENGKVVETWVTWDNITVLGQLGHFPLNPAE
jgi:steroid delta-isomerase-like uncharacterized protein